MEAGYLRCQVIVNLPRSSLGAEGYLVVSPVFKTAASVTSWWVGSIPMRSRQ